VLAEFGAAVDLLRADGVPSLSFLALPNGDRKESKSLAVEEQIASDKSFPFE
jgi:hypothetical protein